MAQSLKRVPCLALFFPTACPAQDFFGGYDHSARGGVVHVANHHISPGKKQWTWGNHEFGWVGRGAAGGSTPPTDALGWRRPRADTRSDSSMHAWRACARACAPLPLMLPAASACCSYAWDRNLSDEDGPYIELMAGVFTDNQPDFSFLAPYETKTFSQHW